MKTEIIVVTDNRPNEALEGEWGLCLLIRFNGKKILVDAGASELFLKNMEGLGEDVKDVDLAVLSHAHYDHANGFPAFFAHNDKARLYISAAADANCYKKGFLFHKYIGIPRTLIRDHGDRIERIPEVRRIMEGAYIVPHHTEGLAEIGRREKMYRRTQRGWITDDFAHEQSLVLETDRGLLIINSCSHGGADNIIREVREAFPDNKIYGYIGGLHLYNKTPEEVLRVAGIFKDAELEYVCTGHCTKEAAFAILKEQLGDKLEQLQVGLRIEI